MLTHSQRDQSSSRLRSYRGRSAGVLTCSSLWFYNAAFSRRAFCTDRLKLAKTQPAGSAGGMTPPAVCRPAAVHSGQTSSGFLHSEEEWVILSSCLLHRIRASPSVWMRHMTMLWSHEHLHYRTLFGRHMRLYFAVCRFKSNHREQHNINQRGRGRGRLPDVRLWGGW